MAAGLSFTFALVSSAALPTFDERSAGQMMIVRMPVMANSTAPITKPTPMVSMNFDPRKVPADWPTIIAPP